jgi:hypothetical protein
MLCPDKFSREFGTLLRGKSGFMTSKPLNSLENLKGSNLHPLSLPYFFMDFRPPIERKRKADCNSEHNGQTQSALNELQNSTY